MNKHIKASIAESQTCKGSPSAIEKTQTATVTTPLAVNPSIYPDWQLSTQVDMLEIAGLLPKQASDHQKAYVRENVLSALSQLEGRFLTSLLYVASTLLLAQMCEDHGHYNGNE